MSSYSVSRLSLYATISALEQDLRDLIVIHLIPQLDKQELLGDLLVKAQERSEKDKHLFEEEITAEDLILYIDFAESYQLLSKHKNIIPKTISSGLKHLTRKLDKLIPIRNRVMHSRPLGYEDFSITLDVATDIISNHQEIGWKSLKETLIRLQKDPSFVLGLSIPTYYTSHRDQNHNLPIPDFDETGFIGRRKYVDQLVNLCLGSYPVITIHGEGGLGKTALALKVAYEILDRDDFSFDAIAWVTSKTQQLTTQEIRRIEDSISDSLNMFKKVSEFLAGETSQEPLEEVLGYLKEFKILLIIDNLETILDERIRNFLGRLTSTNSKIIITSRISVGAYDYPVKLEPMDTNDSVQLLRTLSKIRGVDKHFRTDNNAIAEQCNKMHNNPAYIKWFISAIQVGQRPEQILAQPDMFLDFCMSNVYEYLSENSRKVTSLMQYSPGKRSYGEIAFLNDMSSVDLRESINQLLRTNMIIISSISRGGSFESQYELSELARDYLNRKHPVRHEFIRSLSKRMHQFANDLETMRAIASGDPYSFNNIVMRSKSDKFIAKHLFDALRQIRNKQFALADSLITEAKKLAPEYFEVYRVEAFLRFNEKDYPGASRAYETAIELAPDSAPLRKWYASFLMRYISNYEGALYHLQEAARLDPRSAEVQLEISRTYMYLMRFSDAESCIKKLRNRGNLSEKEMRVVCDLQLQLLTRQAVDAFGRRNYISSLNYVETLMREYQSIPKNVFDRRMKDKLDEIIPLAKNIYRRIQDSDAKSLCLQCIDWLNKEANISEQTVDNSESVTVGQILEGQVEKIEDYGVFIGTSNFYGLLHISNISHKFVSQERMRQIFVLNRNVKVYVRSKDEKGRYQLSTKELEENEGDILTNPNYVFQNAEETIIRAGLKSES